MNVEDEIAIAVTRFQRGLRENSANLGSNRFRHWASCKDTICQAEFLEFMAQEPALSGRTQDSLDCRNYATRLRETHAVLKGINGGKDLPHEGAGGEE